MAVELQPTELGFRRESLWLFVICESAAINMQQALLM